MEVEQELHGAPSSSIAARDMTSKPSAVTSAPSDLGFSRPLIPSTPGFALDARGFRTAENPIDANHIGAGRVLIAAANPLKPNPIVTDEGLHATASLEFDAQSIARSPIDLEKAELMHRVNIALPDRPGQSSSASRTKEEKRSFKRNEGYSQNEAQLEISPSQRLGTKTTPAAATACVAPHDLSAPRPVGVVQDQWSVTNTAPVLAPLDLSRKATKS
jgi:hypothetical protein